MRRNQRTSAMVLLLMPIGVCASSFVWWHVYQFELTLVPKEVAAMIAIVGNIASTFIATMAYFEVKP